MLHQTVVAAAAESDSSSSSTVIALSSVGFGNSFVTAVTVVVSSNCSVVVVARLDSGVVEIELRRTGFGHFR